MRLIRRAVRFAAAPSVALLALASAPATNATLDEVVFTVGGDKEAGKALAEAHGGKWAKSPSKAFKWASEALAEGGSKTVTVRLAAGEYDGDLGSGANILPSFNNPEADLVLQGGWSADFTTRDPFGRPPT